MRYRKATFLLALAAGACLPNQAQDIQQMQAILELGDAMNEVRMTLGDLQDQLDSLRMATAKQDTVIRQLANLAGVPVPR